MLGIAGNYFRVVLKQLFAFPGMGVTRVLFTFELVNKEQASNGYPLWLGGRVEVLARGGSHPYVGHLRPSTAQPINLGGFGQETSTQLALELSGQQLWLIDENRVSGGVRFFVTFSGQVLIDGQFVAIPETQAVTHDISQSDWLELVRQTGLRRTLLLELDVPDALTQPALTESLNYYSLAQTRYSEGGWRETVECIRQSLAALVGKKPDDEDQETDVKDAISDARRKQNGLGYEPRRELVRRAAKFMADLGAHPETAETRKADAYAALMIAGGLLHSFTVPQV